MAITATTSAITSHVRSALTERANAAAGTNGILSRAEQATLSDALLLAGAEGIRTDSPGTMVNVNALVERVAGRVAALLGQVNQQSGAGASKISIAEVQALAGLDADVARLVAGAYLAVTGREVPGIEADTVITPPPPPVAGRLAISVATLDPRGAYPYTADPVVLADGSVQLSRGAELGATLQLQLAHRTITATVNTASGSTTNMATVVDMVEAIRRAAPDLHVHVREHASGNTVVELWDTPPPPPSAPTYLFAEMKSATGDRVARIQMRGPLNFIINPVDDAPAGTTLSIRLDDKVYSATSTALGHNRAVLRKVRDLMQADGRTVQLKEYASAAPWTFRVTG